MNLELNKMECKKYDLLALSNTLTDVVISCTEEEMLRIGFKRKNKSFFDVVTPINFQYLLELENDKKKTNLVSYNSGGSPANVALNFGVLGFNSGLFGTLGTDDYSLMYLSDLNNCNVDSKIKIIDGQSPVCYVLVASDGEKAPAVRMGVGDYLAPFNLSDLESVDIFHTSGYEVATDADSCLNSVIDAKKRGAKICFDLANPKHVSKHIDKIEKIISYCSFLFMTEEETVALGNILFNGVLDANLVDYTFRTMANKIDYVVLKKGSKGSVVSTDGKFYDIPIYPVSVANTNGAGDAYLSGFLYGYLKNKSLESCGHIASKVASKVCGRKESYLHKNDLSEIFKFVYG